jgi:regulator of sirC expression with transglutaminase-like and TPR domain
MKVTVADYWNIINESVPEILNNKKDFKKKIRYLLLYTEYFRNKRVLGTSELDRGIKMFKDYHRVLDYVQNEVPKSIPKEIHGNYLKRYFYTWAGFYKDNKEYEAQKFLYHLCHSIIKEAKAVG